MPADVRALDPEQEHAWRVLMRLLVVLPRAIDEDLVQRSGGLTLTRYIVLMRLSEAPGRSLRMSALADAASISPSRMTRIIQSMHAEGLVERQAAPQDARASLAVLTDAGLQLLQRTWPAHLAGVRALVMDHVDACDLPQLTRITERLLASVAQAPGAVGVTEGCPPQRAGCPPQTA